jgi:hypothetical protein
MVVIYTRHTHGCVLRCGGVCIWCGIVGCAICFSQDRAVGIDYGLQFR